MNSSNKFQ